MKTKIEKRITHPVGTIYTRFFGKRQYRFIKVTMGQGLKNWKQHHRYVMECHLGRELTSGEQVHHIDGDSLNNELSNLALLSIHDHTQVSRLVGHIDRPLAKVIVQTLLARYPQLLG